MWRYVGFILIFQTANCEEITTIKNEATSESFDLLKNKPNDDNNTIVMERIIQPSAQTQQINRALVPTNSSHKSKSDFKPSPHLETYYEFNKVPVPPAFPEAKHFNFAEFNAQWAQNHYATTERSWTVPVKFPTPMSKQRPYQFYNEDKSSTGKSFSLPSKSDTPIMDTWNKFMGNYEPKKPDFQQNQFDFSAPVEVPGAGIPKTFADNWNYEQKKPVMQKHQFDFSAPVEAPYKTNSEFGAVEKPHRHDMQGNPWKKIIGLLTAFIPIGLLISALTPTVITVTSMNGTQQSRSRAENSGDPRTRQVLSLLNHFDKLNSSGCEDRILCELLLSASTTRNAEQHVENLLDTFTENGKAVEKAEEMKRIFEAIKNQDCRSIVCKNIREDT